MIAFSLIEEGKGKIVGTWCHYDGYLMGVGYSLLNAYNTAELAYMVASSGYLSGLAKTVEGFHTEPHANDDPSFVLESKADLIHRAGNSGCEFVYLYDKGAWLYWDIDKDTGTFLTYSDMMPGWKYARDYFAKAMMERGHGAKQMEEFQEEVDKYTALIEKHEEC